LNASDFTRFARSQKDQIMGQAIGLPGTMVLFSVLGVITTSATAVIFGQIIWDPVALVPMLPSPILGAVCLVGIILATLSVNIPANLVSASYDASNLAPKHISMWRGALLTAVLATAIMPWRLLKTADTYIFDWLGNCAIVLAPIAGILIADYWLVRGKTLVVEDLYRSQGAYTYWGGVNVRALIAAGVGIGLAYIGLFMSPLRLLHEMGWITAFVSALVVYRLITPTVRN
jgi:nucleobase:cation symporter-1, NCS1 family